MSSNLLLPDSHDCLPPVRERRKNNPAGEHTRREQQLLRTVTGFIKSLSAISLWIKLSLLFLTLGGLERENCDKYLCCVWKAIS